MDTPNPHVRGVPISTSNLSPCQSLRHLEEDDIPPLDICDLGWVALAILSLKLYMIFPQLCKAQICSYPELCTPQTSEKPHPISLPSASWPPAPTDHHLWGRSCRPCQTFPRRQLPSLLVSEEEGLQPHVACQCYLPP
jgi:hypothetical protein